MKKPVFTTIIFALALIISPSFGIAQSSADDYIRRGNARCAKGDLDGGIADYSHALKLNPKYATAYFNRGLAKHQKGDLDGAIADYDRSLELDPNNAKAYGSRGNVKCAKGDPDGAIVDYNQSLELDPKLAPSNNNRGNAKCLKADFEGGIGDYTRALELNPKYGDACKNRGFANFVSRKWTDGLQDFRRFCDISARDQDYPRLYIWMIRSRLGEAEGAGKELAVYLDERSNATSADWVSKVAGHLLGRVSEADLLSAAASSNAEREREQRCEAWFFAGMKRLLSGDKTVAADDFRKCLATEDKLCDQYQAAKAELKALGQ